MRPIDWRRSKNGDPNLTDDGVRYSNCILFHRGDRVIECKLGSYQLDNLELFDLPRDHPGWSAKSVQRGVRPIRPIAGDTIIGFYAGIYRPGSFADENPYVFGLQPSELDLVIDGLLVGNITRYINDPKGTGKEANLEAEDVVIKQGSQSIRCVQFRSRRDILIGEELLLEYEASVKGYWDQFQPEVIDLTMLPDDALVVKRERLNDEKEPQLKKSKSLPDNTIVILNSEYVKDIVIGNHDFKLIRLASSWTIDLILPAVFLEIDPSAIELDLLKYDWSSKSFKSCSPVDMFEITLSENGIVATICHDTRGRISPFPYTSFGKANITCPMMFTAKHQNVTACSQMLLVVGNNTPDFDYETWSTDRKNKFEAAIRENFP